MSKFITINGVDYTRADSVETVPPDYSSVKATLLDFQSRIAALEAIQRHSKFQLLKTEVSYGEENAHTKDILLPLRSFPVAGPVLTGKVIVEGSFELHGKTYTYKAEASPDVNQ